MKKHDFFNEISIFLLIFSLVNLCRILILGSDFFQQLLY
jgi:hypothetical protein